MEPIYRRLLEVTLHGANRLDGSDSGLFTLPETLVQLWANPSGLQARANFIDDLVERCGEENDFPFLDSALETRRLIASMKSSLERGSDPDQEEYLHFASGLHFEFDGADELTAIPEISELFDITNLMEHVETNSESIELGDRAKELSEYLVEHLGQRFESEFAIDKLAEIRSLDLSFNYLSQVPVEVFLYPSEIDLSNNEIVELPAAVAAYDHITGLYLSANRLVTLPSWVARCVNLESLEASGNQLDRLPSLASIGGLEILALRGNELDGSQIEQLPESLKFLDVSSNPISSLPEDFWQPNLRNLQIADTLITQLPHNFSERVPALQTLSAEGANLTSLPETFGEIAAEYIDLSFNSLSDLPESMAQLDGDREVLLEGNPLPETVLHAASLGWEALSQYLQSLEQQTDSCLEAKLILVGEGNVGKSTMVSRLRGEEFVRDRPTTHGISRSTVVVDRAGSDTQKVTLHAWDFGGQEIYRVTHPFYFSQDAVFLVVWRPRDGLEQSGVEFWLERIAMRVRGRARVILVSTHKDEGRLSHLNMARVKARYGNLVVGHIAVDSESLAGFPELEATISETASSLDHIDDPIATSWLELRDWLAECEGPFVKLETYYEHASTLGISFIAADTWLRLLHVFGEVLYYQHEPSLADVIVTDPEVLATAMSFLLESDEIEACHGVASHDLITRVWTEKMPTLQRHLYPFLLRLIECHQVSYRISEAASLIAPVVSFDRPDELPWSDGENRELNASFEIDAEPIGMVSWLTCAFHELSTGLHWREGLFLRDPEFGNEALIESDGTSISLKVRGPHPSQLFTVIRRKIASLLKQRWAELEHRCFVPCHGVGRIELDCEGQPSGALEFGSLMIAKDRGIRNVMCPGCMREVPLQTLLDGFDTTGRGTAGNGLLELSVKVDRLAEAVEAVDGEVLKANQAEIAEAVSELRRLVSFVASEVPKLFTISTKERRALDPRKLASTPMVLQLWCEYPQCEHPMPDRYEFTRDAEWFVRARGVITVMARVMRLLPVVGAAAGVAVEAAQYDKIDEDLRLMSEIGSASFALEGSIAGDSSTDEIAGAMVSAFGIEGVEARMVKQLIVELDPAKHFAGLVKVNSPAHGTLWVCEEHRAAMLPDLPTVGHAPTGSD